MKKKNDNNPINILIDNMDMLKKMKEVYDKEKRGDKKKVNSIYKQIENSFKDGL